MKTSTNLPNSYLQLRSNLLDSNSRFDLTKLENTQLVGSEIHDSLKFIIEGLPEGGQKLFFQEFQRLAKAISHILNWGYKELTAGSDSERELRAAKNNGKISVRVLKGSAIENNFLDNLVELANHIQTIESIDKIENLVFLLANMPIPIPMRKINSDSPFARIRSKDSETNDQKTPAIVTAKLYINDEPWANPQMLSPRTAYGIKATITVNHWPVGMKSLSLRPVSTSQQKFYSMDMEEIQKPDVEGQNQYAINGHLAFNYVQHSFEDVMTIKMYARYAGEGDEEFIPPLIGYNELRAKVLDPSQSNISTGYPNINLKVLEILKGIERDFSKISKKEKKAFTTLLTGIANFQGVSLQEGYYKNKSKVKESEFRDKLTGHLRAHPNLGEEIEKEGEVSGGKVEISFQGAIAELKVSYKSDRNAVMAKYENQAAAYVAGKSRHLGILVILDLSPKSNPVASPDENIFVRNPVLAGDTDPSKPKTRIITIFVEGNTPTPSSYSSKKFS